MDLTDRVFIATVATLSLFVLFIERRLRGVPAHVLPPQAGSRLLKFTNVPDCRRHEIPVVDVAVYDISTIPEFQ